MVWQTKTNRDKQDRARCAVTIFRIHPIVVRPCVIVSSRQTTNQPPTDKPPTHATHAKQRLLVSETLYLPPHIRPHIHTQ